MTTEAVYSRHARREIEEARAWYRESDPAVAATFMDELATTLEMIVDLPQTWPLYRDPGGEPVEAFRWKRVRGFPYAVIYDGGSEGRVRVVAVTHFKRRPGYWIAREH